MKKSAIVIISLIVIICLTLSIKNILRYRFGYFVEGPELKYEHRDADVLKLENGNVLILGKNAHSCLTPEACKDNIMPVVEVPSEIYNAKTNKIEELRLPNNIRYRAKGILLENDRLLLTHAYDPSDDRYPKVKKVGEDIKNIKPPYLYDSMAVVNLDAMKVEKISKRKLDNNILLNLIINEAYDNQDIADLLFANAPSKIFWHERTVLNNNEVIFIDNDITNKEKYGINKYAFGAKNIDHIATIDCKPSKIQKLNSQEILIICSNFTSSNYPIKIYNTNTNEIKTISHMPKYRCVFNSILIKDGRVLIAGGNNCSYPLTTYYRNSLILDLGKNKVYNAAKLPFDAHEPNMVLLNNGDVLILDNKLNAYAKRTLIFKNNVK